MVRRNVPFEAGVSIGVIQAGANENSILSDCAICDYSDRLLGARRQRARLRLAMPRPLRPPPRAGGEPFLPEQGNESASVKDGPNACERGKRALIPQGCVERPQP